MQLSRLEALRFAARGASSPPRPARAGEYFVGIFTVAIATVFFVLHDLYGRRALAYALAGGAGGSVPGGAAAVDFWFFLGAAASWAAILGFLCAVCVILDPVDVGAAARRAVDGGFRLTLGGFWWTFLSGSMATWLATSMDAGADGPRAATVALNTDSVGYMFASTLISSCILIFLWGAFWYFPVVFVPSNKSVYDKAVGQWRITYPDGSTDFREEDPDVWAAAHKTLTIGLVFVPAASWASYVSGGLTTWWVRTVMAVGGPGPVGTVGCLFAAFLLMYVVAMALVAALAAARGEHAAGRVVETMRAGFAVFATVCVAEWITRGAVVALSQKMIPDGPAFNSTVCPAPYGAYPAQYPGEALLLLVPVFALTVFVYYAFSYVVDGTRWVPTWPVRTAPWTAVWVAYAPAPIAVDLVDGAHPVTWTAGFALGTLLATDGSTILLQNLHSFCNPVQFFGSRLLGLFVVLLLLALAWALALNTVGRRWPAAMRYLGGEDPAVGLLGEGVRETLIQTADAARSAGARAAERRDRRRGDVFFSSAKVDSSPFA